MTRKVALYEIPEVLESAEILDDSLLGAYNESFSGWNERAKATLGKMNSIGGEFANSSPLMFIRLHNSGILPKDTRLSTR